MKAFWGDNTLCIPMFACVVFCMRKQVLNFAVKLALRQPEDTRVQSLASFVLEMARFDLSHDLRDRARFMTAMLGLATADEGVDEAALLALNAKAGQVRSQRAGLFGAFSKDSYCCAEAVSIVLGCVLSSAARDGGGGIRAYSGLGALC